MMDFHIQLNHLVQIKSAGTASDCHSHGVANKIAHVVVVQEVGIFGEDGALLRLLDVRLDPSEAFFAGLVEENEHHLQRVDITLL